MNLSGIHSEELVKGLRARGLDVLSADPQCLTSFPKMDLLRMSIMRTDERDMEKGIQIFAEEPERVKQTSRIDTPFLWILNNRKGIFVGRSMKGWIPFACALIR